VIGDTLNWDNHIDQLISRLSSTCYAVRAVKAMFSRKALRMLYFCYIHTVISYGIILGGYKNFLKIKTYQGN
jgi:hypothetical protein